MSLRAWLRATLCCLAALVFVMARVAARQPAPRPDPLAESFKGLTTNGNVVPGLFPIRVTGVSTGPVKTAAKDFLESLTAEQRAKTAFPVDDSEWRKWQNIHRYARQGVSFKEMTEAQRERAFDLLRAALSAKGLEKSRNIMRLNGHVAELVQKFEEYGEYLYYFTVMGEPSDKEPWGFQLDGHHLVVNYFVLGDQVVMTPTFMGSEPVTASSGKYAGTTVLQDEQQKGLALMESLTPDQRRAATLAPEKTRNNALAQAFRDNVTIDYAGLRAAQLSESQRRLFLELIAEYVGNLDEGHAKVRMEDVKARLDDTYFAWIGEVGPACFFALPTEWYPTVAQRHRGFTGGAIGVHGPHPAFRWLGRATVWADWTLGCVAVGTNSDIEVVTSWVRRYRVSKIAIL